MPPGRCPTPPQCSRSPNEAMGTRYLLALCLILLVLGFGECGWQGRRVCALSIFPSQFWSGPGPAPSSLLPCPLPSAAGSSALLSQSPLQRCRGPLRSRRMRPPAPRCSPRCRNRFLVTGIQPRPPPKTCTGRPTYPPWMRKSGVTPAPAPAPQTQGLVHT